MRRSDVEMFSNISDTWVRTAGRPPGRTDWMFRVEKKHVPENSNVHDQKQITTKSPLSLNCI